MEKTNHKKLLVLRFSALGDVTMIAPVLQEFIEQNPNVEVYVASRPFMGNIFKQFPQIKFIPVDLNNKYKGFFSLFKLYKELKQYNFDYVADFHNVIRSKIITTLFQLNGTKTATLDKGRTEKRALVDQKNRVFKQLKLTTERYADVLRQLGFKLNLTHQIKPKSIKEPKSIGIAPFAAFTSKMYPIDKMKIVTNKLAENGYKIYLFGGGKTEIDELKSWENFNHNITSLAGTVSFEEELQAIAKLEAMISMDSANMHLASLMGTRTISIWGGTHPYAGFLGYGQAMEDVIQDETLKCRPTSIFGKDPKGFQNFDYFQNLSAEDVYLQIVKRLENL
ncbi:glycosyltransferase family 9 protein [Empedobacter stercoris]|uniref:glycosyltransferase family 9 protein n=1 Tax=Empedobacter stercoris TaxID=1628248 RepID=UPI00166237E0|nr:glycosyltransferase family 9 protein [Empedobacter stercoris]MCA4808767.1 glycosyltransferase family 9 protein [Empedobacter stercoris]QNT15704.1 glycosyltransferase family 9 protein [Empedobacter stercoris]